MSAGYNAWGLHFARNCAGQNTSELPFGMHTFSSGVFLVRMVSGLSAVCSAFDRMDTDLSEQVLCVCDGHWRWFDILFSKSGIVSAISLSRRCLRKRNSCCSLFLPKLSLLRFPVLLRSCLHQLPPLFACNPNAVGSGEAWDLPNRCCHRSQRLLFVLTILMSSRSTDGNSFCFSWTFKHSLSLFSRCLSHSNLERG